MATPGPAAPDPAPGPAAMLRPAQPLLAAAARGVDNEIAALRDENAQLRREMRELRNLIGEKADAADTVELRNLIGQKADAAATVQWSQVTTTDDPHHENNKWNNFLIRAPRK